MSSWIFTQLPPGPATQLTLSGWAAPFGRPRQKPVVGTGTKLRVATTRYPGNDGPPTRHAFGSMERDWDLNGRWMDKDLGAGGAQFVAQQWKTFVNDKRITRIAWGDNLSYTGLIESIEVDWESPTEAVWRMHILIDSDDGEPKARSSTSTDTVQVVPDIEDAMAAVAKLPTRIPSLDTLTGELFDTLDSFISPISSLGASAVHFANSIDSFETATVDELQRLRTGLAQFRTAYTTLSDTMDAISDDAFLFDRQADDDIQWLSEKAAAAVRSVALLASIASTQRQIDIATRGVTATAYIAKPGDTWESISTAMYGGPADAGKIRAANGVRFGELPMAARQYQIPRT